MAHYEDLTPYNYHHYCEKELNIGWLEKDQPFSIGNAPEGLIDKLKVFAEDPFLQTKGFHRCPFCEGNNYSSNEIRVVGKDGIAYASPKMIIHYVEAHGYLPPQEFVDAVMNGPLPGTEEYKDSIRRLPESWERRKPDMNDEDYEDKMRMVMIDKLSQEVDQKVIEDILKENPNFQKFVEAYNKVMPAVYNTSVGNKKKS